ncbi:hypothetical protein BDV97DRAFT_367564 [Delphinella strobiligena]|nr:hypothetical protein BDV97DRAFT_367564 [Delphinella strobiligena]
MQSPPAHPTNPPRNPETSNHPTPPTPAPFMALPPELRTEIYIHHFTPHLSPALWTHLPSLLSVSQQIRHEALPIYYQHTRFVLEYPSYDPYTSNSPETPLREQDDWLDVHLRYETLAPNLLARIDRLQLRVYFPVCNGTSAVQAAIDVDLGTAKVLLKQVYRGEEIEFLGMGEDWEDVALRKVKGLVGEIAARKGEGRLRFEDLVRFGRALTVV